MSLSHAQAESRHLKGMRNHHGALESSLVEDISLVDEDEVEFLILVHVQVQHHQEEIAGIRDDVHLDVDGFVLAAFDIGRS